MLEDAVGLSFGTITGGVVDDKGVAGTLEG